jgi:prevent-host-death family protein
MAQRSSRVSVADAKKSLSQLLGRVAYAQESITILKRGRPMARLVPVTDRRRSSLADVKGWLDPKDPFFAIMDQILTARHVRHFRRIQSLPVEDWTA